MITPKGWPGFVEALKPQWEVNDTTNKIIGLIDDQDLCIALWGCLHQQAVSWVYKEVPALGNKRPIDLVKGEAGKIEVMQILISNPWW